MPYLILVIVLTLLQALLFRQIHLFGHATPLLYVYTALVFRRGTPAVIRLPLCFVQGLAVDVFCNTPGLSAAAMTLAGFAQPLVARLYDKDTDATTLPAVATFGFGRYLAYAATLVLLFTCTLFALEAFSTAQWLHAAVSAAASTALTLVMITTIDCLRR